VELNITPLVLSTSELAAEIAEHKGIGHPDTVCDALAERFSVGLCHFYMHQFDGIFHHNVDKALLWGGASKPAFGGGEITAPIEIYLSGRATREVNGVIVPVEEIMQTAAMGFLREEFRWLDPEKHIKLHCLVRPGSADLVELYKRQAKKCPPCYRSSPDTQDRSFPGPWRRCRWNSHSPAIDFVPTSSAQHRRRALHRFLPPIRFPSFLPSFLLHWDHKLQRARGTQKYPWQSFDFA